MRTVVLVEGVSDQVALEALAARRGRSLAAEGVVVVAMGGAQKIGRLPGALRPAGVGPQARGPLRCRGGGRLPARARAGRPRLRPHPRRDGTTRLLRVRGRPRGRADPFPGAASVEQVIDAQGELGSFRTFQKQPARRGRTTDEQLRRFLGTQSGRKARSAGCSSTRSISRRCLGRWTASSITSPVVRRCRRARRPAIARWRGSTAAYSGHGTRTISSTRSRPPRRDHADTRNTSETAPGPSEWFTGAVYLDPVATPSDASRLSASSVHFTPGARTAWHTHPNGQTIYVTRASASPSGAAGRSRSSAPATACSSSRARSTGTARRRRAS